MPPSRIAPEHWSMAEAVYPEGGSDAAHRLLVDLGYPTVRKATVVKHMENHGIHYGVRRECVSCGAFFTPGKPNAETCSPECSREKDAARKRKPQGPDMEELFDHYRTRESLAVDQVPDGSTLVSLSDIQWPFVDRPLWDRVGDFIRQARPDYLMLNGDILDCYLISKFITRPSYKKSLKDEVVWARQTLGVFGQQATHIYWIDGNHEQRWYQYIWEKAPDLDFAINDLDVVLDLPSLASGYVPYGRHVDFLGFVFTHGERVGLYSPRMNLEAYHSSGVSGHTHRMKSWSKTDKHGRTHSWYEQGCLCLRGLDYVRSEMDWQPGFMIGTVYDNALYPQLIRVVETKRGRGFVVNGEWFKIRD